MGLSASPGRDGADMTGSHDDSPRLSLAMFVQPTCGNRGQTYGCGLSEHPSRSGRSPDPSLAANGLGPDDTTETYPDGGGAKLQRQLPAMRQAPAQPGKPVQPVQLSLVPMAGRPRHKGAGPGWARTGVPNPDHETNDAEPDGCDHGQRLETHRLPARYSPAGRPCPTGPDAGESEPDA